MPLVAADAIPDAGTRLAVKMLSQSWATRNGATDQRFVTAKELESTEAASRAGGAAASGGSSSGQATDAASQVRQLQTRVQAEENSRATADLALRADMQVADKELATKIAQVLAQINGAAAGKWEITWRRAPVCYGVALATGDAFTAEDGSVVALADGTALPGQRIGCDASGRVTLPAADRATGQWRVALFAGVQADGSGGEKIADWRRADGTTEAFTLSGAYVVPDPVTRTSLAARGTTVFSGGATLVSSRPYLRARGETRFRGYLATPAPEPLSGNVRFALRAAAYNVSLPDKLRVSADFRVYSPSR
jgi:hypothetical protein